MTKPEMIEAIRNAAILANQKIVEPKFGCEILVHLPHSELICRVIKEGNDGSIMLDYSGFWWTKEQLSYDKKFEIIGRDIGLSDVLMVIKGDMEHVIDENGHFLQLHSAYETGLMKYEGTGIYWDLTKPLHDQSEETIRFIFNLLKND